jgi:DNA-binding beta-propeller fold protein YncE
MKMAVLDANTGNTVTALPIGPGPDAVGYDPDRSLIFTANGDAQGSLTIIRQDVTDSYAVIQTLPTRERARTLAVNSSTGQVYLVTVIEVAKVGVPPANGIGTLKMTPQDSSFQVLVVGN